jgi:hypothetical protein
LGGAVQQLLAIVVLGGKTPFSNPKTPYTYLNLLKQSENILKRLLDFEYPQC